MKLYITRHGETPMNAAHRVCGRTDIDLPWEHTDMVEKLKSYL